MGRVFTADEKKHMTYGECLEMLGKGYTQRITVENKETGETNTRFFATSDEADEFLRSLDHKEYKVVDGRKLEYLPGTTYLFDRIWI